MKKCATVSCSNVAKLRVFWPGQRRDFCADCAKRAVYVAQAMGFELSFGKAPTEEREPYEPPAIESTVPLTAAAVLAAAQLTPEQIEERRRIGEERAPQRTEALQRWIKKSVDHAAELCLNPSCGHARGAHTPDCEECTGAPSYNCERFVDHVIVMCQHCGHSCCEHEGHTDDCDCGTCAEFCP